MNLTTIKLAYAVSVAMHVAGWAAVVFFHEAPPARGSSGHAMFAVEFVHEVETRDSPRFRDPAPAEAERVEEVAGPKPSEQAFPEKAPSAADAAQAWSAILARVAPEVAAEEIEVAPEPVAPRSEPADPPVAEVARVQLVPLAAMPLVSRGRPTLPPEAGEPSVRGLLRRVKPVYPLKARRLGHQGRVVVRAAVAADGKVIEVRVTESSGFDELDRAVVKAVRKSLFEAEVDADAMRTRDLSFRFQLEEL